jgi:hypothetical protein
MKSQGLGTVGELWREPWSTGPGDSEHESRTKVREREGVAEKTGVELSDAELDSVVGGLERAWIRPQRDDDNTPAK